LFTGGKVGRFEELALPHLDAAYNLARWLARNDQDAEDIVQESYLRALSSFSSFRGANARGWMLKIVRNTSYDWLRKRRKYVEFDEALHSEQAVSDTPESAALRNASREEVRQALEEMPPEYREVLVLRELEEMDYKEIAEIAGIPMGTVMSRLSRARDRLRKVLEESGT
jgi:RNA polymerase sigma-70 factor (ECF subfamily)